MKSVTTHQAKTQLSRLLDDVARGEEVVIRRGATPMARLLPFHAPAGRSRPRVGTRTAVGVKIAADAFAPLSAAELREWGLG